MKRSITIEIDDNSPNIELCGEKCKFLKTGVCELFKKQLEEYGVKKINNFDEKTIEYENVIAFSKWKRYEHCIYIFYSFGFNGESG